MNFNLGDWAEFVYDNDRFYAKITHIPSNPGELWEVKATDGKYILINTGNVSFRMMLKVEAYIAKKLEAQSG